jgi:ADP-ribose pyrophosphatase YjhB (NUDIX family)
MNFVRVGIGVIILDKDNKILLGHRSKNKKDTGGIVGRDTWTLPGGKQEFDETYFECGIREVKEETGLDIKNPKLLYAFDDFGDDRHFITLCLITSEYDGIPQVMEPDKEDEWNWFDIDNLPDNLYLPSKQCLDYYKDEIWKTKGKN